MSAASQLTTIALNVARNTAWPVFPCGENKAPAIPKREGGNGLLDATIEPDSIRRMFAHPAARLIGVVTGERSGFDVLDVDVKHDAARAWLTAAQDRIPATRTYRTRSGGFHLLFRHVEGVHNTESHIARGIDTRGTGGYIVLWFAAELRCMDQSPVTAWPDWLLEALFYKPEPEPLPPRPQRRFRSNGNAAQELIARTLAKVAAAPDGQRHATLRAAACTIGGVMDAADLPRSTATDLLLSAILQAGGPRVDRDNALGTIAWGLTKGASSPLTVGGR